MGDINHRKKESYYKKLLWALWITDHSPKDPKKEANKGAVLSSQESVGSQISTKPTESKGHKDVGDTVLVKEAGDAETGNVIIEEDCSAKSSSKSESVHEDENILGSDGDDQHFGNLESEESNICKPKSFFKLVKHRASLE